MKPHYSMTLQWSEEDQTFVVSLLEFGPYCQTHGDTYADAVKNGEEVITMLITSAEEKGELLQTARMYQPVHSA